MLHGQCHCGAIQYDMREGTEHQALCHCTDCRRHAGAPIVAWAMVPAESLSIRGVPQTYASSEHGRRHFCGTCGTSLFYTNETVLPGMIDVQIATLDDPDALPPRAHIQVAERIGWMATAHELPAFQRYPEQA